MLNESEELTVSACAATASLRGSSPFGIAEPLVRSLFRSRVLGISPPDSLHRQFQTDLFSAA